MHGVRGCRIINSTSTSACSSIRSWNIYAFVCKMFNKNWMVLLVREFKSLIHHLCAVAININNETSNTLAKRVWNTSECQNECCFCCCCGFFSVLLHRLSYTFRCVHRYLSIVCCSSSASFCWQLKHFFITNRNRNEWFSKLNDRKWAKIELRLNWYMRVSVQQGIKRKMWSADEEKKHETIKRSNELILYV